MLNFFKKNKITKLLLFTLFALFLTGIGSYDKLLKPASYQKIITIYDKTLNRILGIKNVSLKECLIPTVNNIPINSTVLIGHAYGSPNHSKAEDFISKKVLNFLQINSKNINKVIFTGDVFSVPSAKKWSELENIFDNKFEIHITPGNHDISGSVAKKIFLETKFGSNSYPYTIKFKDSIIILDDSTSSNWNTSLDTIIKIKENKKKLNFVARHNIPIEELKAYVNSMEGISQNFIKFSEFKKLMPKDKEIIWIIGDSGAFKSLPRIKCLQKDNHKFVINGIGDVENDKVTLIYQNKLFSYSLN